MGNSESISEDGSGYRVLRVDPDSAAAQAGIEPVFDFITRIEDTPLDTPGISIQAEIQRLERSAIVFQVYNVRLDEYREVTVKWDPELPVQSRHLGVCLHYCRFDSVLDDGLRVLDVKPNSPAALVELQPMNDYIFGDNEAIYKSVDDLLESVEAHINRTLSILVYNSVSNKFRIAKIIPNTNWGGEGCLGCDIGVGYLHRVPRCENNSVSKKDILNSANENSPTQDESDQISLDDTASDDGDGLGNSMILMPTTNLPLQDPGFSIIEPLASKELPTVPTTESFERHTHENIPSTFEDASKSSYLSFDLPHATFRFQTQPIMLDAVATPGRIHPIVPHT